MACLKDIPDMFYTQANTLIGVYNFFEGYCAVNTCILFFVACFAMHACILRTIIITDVLFFLYFFLNHAFFVVFVSKVFQKNDNNVGSTCD